MTMTMVSAKDTILLIAATEGALSTFEKILRESGYHVLVVSNEQTAIDALQQQSPSVIVIDRRACDLERLRLHKPFKTVPIVALGEENGGCTEDECIDDLDRGADLVLCNQTMRQLIARIRAILRRKGFKQSASVVCLAGAIQMDLDRHEVRVNGELVDLTPKEFEILRHFMESPSRVFSRQEMLNCVWGEGYALEEHALDVHIHSLRQKIEEDPSKPKLIVTVRGVGYKFKAAS
jgi:two-component system, OmpR family, response regulator RegX3